MDAHTLTHTHTHLNTQHLKGHGGGTLEGTFPVQGFSPQLVQPTLQTEPESPQTNPESSSSDIITSERARQGQPCRCWRSKTAENTSTRMHTGTHMHTHIHTAHTYVHTHMLYIHVCEHIHAHTHAHTCSCRRTRMLLRLGGSPEIKQNLQGLPGTKAPLVSPFLVCRKKAVKPPQPSRLQRASQSIKRLNRAPSSLWKRRKEQTDTYLSRCTETKTLARW